MAKDTHPDEGTTLRSAGLTSGSTHAKELRGEHDDLGEKVLEDINQVDRVVPPRPDSEAGTPDAQAERD